MKINKVTFTGIFALATFLFVNSADLSAQAVKDSVNSRKPLYGVVGARDRDAISKTDHMLQFNPHWYFQLEDGANLSLRQKEFWGCITNNLMAGAGYNFTPLWGVRGMFGYTQGRGTLSQRKTTYGYEYVEIFADGVLNLSNLISGYRHDRAIDVYPFIGIGTHIATECCNSITETPHLDTPFNGAKAFLAGRAGAFARIRLTNHVSVTLDANVACTNDRFNSKNEGGWDSNFNLLAGLTYRMNPKTRTISRAEAIATAAAAAAAASLASATSFAEEAEKAAVEAEKAAAAAEAAALNAENAAAEAEQAYKNNSNENTLAASVAAAEAATAAYASAVSARARATEVRAAADKAVAARDAAAAAADKATVAANARPVKKAAAVSAAKAADQAAEAATAANAATTAATSAASSATTTAYADADVANKAAEAARLAAAIPAPFTGFSKDVFFGLDEDWLNAQGWVDVMEIIRWMKQNPESCVSLTGYASADKAGDMYNLALSKRRVEKVKLYLKRAKISEDRYDTDYKGERIQPFEVNEQNRVVTCREKK